MPEPTRKVKHKDSGDMMIINATDFDPKLHDPLDGKGNERSSPTVEEYVAAGYSPKNYPPEGHKEIDSPGLKVHNAWKAMANQSTGTGTTGSEAGTGGTTGGSAPAPSGQPGTGGAPAGGAPAPSGQPAGGAPASPSKT